MGNDLSVVNAARVSFGNKSEWDYEESDGYSFKQHLSERDRKLIHYLARHRHTSPFGHCFASFHVRAPVFVARQLVKHKFLRWNVGPMDCCCLVHLVRARPSLGRPSLTSQARASSPSPARRSPPSGLGRVRSSSEPCLPSPPTESRPLCSSMRSIRSLQLARPTRTRPADGSRPSSSCSWMVPAPLVRAGCCVLVSTVGVSHDSELTLL